jgi:hypothetical protein
MAKKKTKRKKKKVTAKKVLGALSFGVEAYKIIKRARR